MKKVNGMQALKKLSIVLILLTSFSAYSFAGRRIDGNGKIKTISKTLDQFYSVDIQTFCNVKVVNGAMPLMKLELDENLVEYLSINVEDVVLRMSRDEWIEATKLQVTLQTPFISELKNAGWGKIEILQLATEEFELNAPTGKISLEGTTKVLQINTSTAKIDASKLNAETVLIQKSSHGKIYLSSTDSVSVVGNKEDIYIENKAYKSKDSHHAESKSSNPIQYVNIKIKNNSLVHRSLVIRGPENRKFSYGFSLFPYASKKERVPVGTRFLRDAAGGEKLLITVEASDDGKTLNLFK